MFMCPNVLWGQHCLPCGTAHPTSILTLELSRSLGMVSDPAPGHLTPAITHGQGEGPAQGQAVLAMHWQGMGFAHPCWFPIKFLIKPPRASRELLVSVSTGANPL